MVGRCRGSSSPLSSTMRTPGHGPAAGRYRHTVITTGSCVVRSDAVMPLRPHDVRRAAWYGPGSGAGHAFSAVAGTLLLSRARTASQTVRCPFVDPYKGATRCRSARTPRRRADAAHRTATAAATAAASGERQRRPLLRGGDQRGAAAVPRPPTPADGVVQNRRRPAGRVVPGTVGRPALDEQAAPPGARAHRRPAASGSIQVLEEGDVAVAAAPP